MRVLVIGGTGFIGGHVVGRLRADGHGVTVLHRGTSCSGAEGGPDPGTVGERQRADAASTAHAPEPGGHLRHLHGARADLIALAGGLRTGSVDVVLDMIPYSEAEALTVVSAFKGWAGRVVAISSGDVYRNYDRLRRLDSGPPDPAPLAEEAPVRGKLYPYRALAQGPEDWVYHYEKILVERAFLGAQDLPATVLRLPMVYGPNDRQHRLFPYLKRMDDGRPWILMGTEHAAWRCSRAYVEDVAEAITLAVTNDRAAGLVFNVGEEEALSGADWVRSIARAAGWDGEVVTLPNDRLPRHLKREEDWRQHLVMDTRRIRELLGFGEVVGREEGLCHTVAWERAHPPAESHEVLDYAAEDAALAVA